MSKNILDTLFSEENKGALNEISRNFDLTPEQTRSAVEELIPALTRGMQKNTSNASGMNDLLDALRTGKHAEYAEKPEVLSHSATQEDGNSILGHIFGTKEVSREVASRVSQKSGISSSILKKMLPVVASLVMGTLSKKILGGGSSQATQAGAGGGLLGMLLDSDRDGSIWDDVLGMAAKTLLR